MHIINMKCIKFTVYFVSVLITLLKIKSQVPINMQRRQGTEGQILRSLLLSFVLYQCRSIHMNVLLMLKQWLQWFSQGVILFKITNAAAEIVSAVQLNNDYSLLSVENCSMKDFMGTVIILCRIEPQTGIITTQIWPVALSGSET